VFLTVLTTKTQLILILIISQDSFESTTNSVIDWIDYYNSPWERVNGIDLISEVETCLQDQDSSTSYSVMWCRRVLSFNNFKSLLMNNIETADIDKYYRKEIRSLLNYQLKSFDSRFIVNENYLLNPENKLEVLTLARKHGLKIPNSVIVNSKKGLLKFSESNENFITKGISGSGSVQLGNNVYSSYTIDVDHENLSELNETFVPCLLQEKLEKDYEIRAFYLDGEFYNMAIFSQSDEQTSTDFRKYNRQKMNRMVPYILPREIEQKLISLMDSLKLNTGSIDIVKTTAGEYVFLEVNPEGQFGMVSHPCNYHLEEKMAKYLIDKNCEA
jgi:ATP-GRASP peptide maturase of grasp-with-spasm system